MHQNAGREKNTTSNRMELTAVIQACKYLGKRHGIIYSDSKYCVDGYYNSLDYWISKDFFTSSGRELKNLDLWKNLSEVMNERIELQWIKARERGSRHFCYNKLVDDLAKRAAGLR
jgi:ribonuclease HI